MMQVTQTELADGRGAIHKREDRPANKIHTGYRPGDDGFEVYGEPRKKSVNEHVRLQAKNIKRMKPYAPLAIAGLVGVAIGVLLTGSTRWVLEKRS